MGSSTMRERDTGKQVVTNGAWPGGIVNGVSCFPHTDGQNLALMMCVLFIYGKYSPTLLPVQHAPTAEPGGLGDFNSRDKAWLALWEAGIVIELPIGVLFYYVSALFIHFNIDLASEFSITLSLAQINLMAQFSSRS